jgi:hypothetical protein
MCPDVSTGETVAFERYGECLKYPCPTCNAGPYQECRPLSESGSKTSGSLRPTLVGLRCVFPHAARKVIVHATVAHATRVVW